MAGNQLDCNVGMEELREDIRVQREALVKHRDTMDRVPAEQSDTDEGTRLHKSVVRNRNCKARRARRKAFRPYYKLTEGERDLREENERMRLVRLRDRMRSKGRIIAPYNTTQFIISDQNDESLQSLERKLQERNCDKQNMIENNISIDVDDEYCHSSPTDEDEEFFSNEFKKDYDIQHFTRLEKMSKEMLLNEYMIIERKNEVLEAKLDNILEKEEEKASCGEADYEFHKGEIPMEPAMADKIRVFQNEINMLKTENQRLFDENLDIKERLKQFSDSSSSSESSSSSSSSSSSDEESDEENLAEKISSLPEDTGYESTQSKDEK